MKTEDPRTIRRFCGAVLEYRDIQPYKSYVKQLREELKDGTMSEKTHQNIIDAIIKNTVSQKEYPFDTLQRAYSLPITAKEFAVRKQRFCAALAKKCGILDGEEGKPFTKKEILNMLLTIADEANECITKDGAFNHQVAGVALKAIDQAVKLSGMCADDDTDTTAEISMDDTSRMMGA